LSKRKQATSERNYLQVRPNALAVWEAKHSRRVSFKTSARDAPRQAGLGEAAHISGISMQWRWLLKEDYLSAGLGLITSVGQHQARSPAID
jgi:hypothetical protein